MKLPFTMPNVLLNFHSASLIELGGEWFSADTIGIRSLKVINAEGSLVVVHMRIFLFRCRKDDEAFLRKLGGHNNS